MRRSTGLRAMAGLALVLAACSGVRVSVEDAAGARLTEHPSYAWGESELAMAGELWFTSFVDQGLAARGFEESGDGAALRLDFSGDAEADRLTMTLLDAESGAPAWSATASGAAPWPAAADEAGRERVRDALRAMVLRLPAASANPSPRWVDADGEVVEPERVRRELERCGAEPEVVERTRGLQARGRHAWGSGVLECLGRSGIYLGRPPEP